MTKLFNCNFRLMTELFLKETFNIQQIKYLLFSTVHPFVARKHPCCIVLLEHAVSNPARLPNRSSFTAGHGCECRFQESSLALCADTPRRRRLCSLQLLPPTRHPAATKSVILFVNYYQLSLIIIITISFQSSFCKLKMLGDKWRRFP